MKEEPYVVVNRAEGAMQSRTHAQISVRTFRVDVDEPESRGGTDLAPTPLEYVLIALCGCTNVTTGRMAEKLRFAYDDLQTFAEAELDTRGRLGEADVPVHYRKVRLTVRIRTDEPARRIDRLAQLVDGYCPVNSLVRAAVSNYEVTWARA